VISVTFSSATAGQFPLCCSGFSEKPNSIKQTNLIARPATQAGFSGNIGGVWWCRTKLLFDVPDAFTGDHGLSEDILQEHGLIHSRMPGNSSSLARIY